MPTARKDAERNRPRIVEAARRVFAEHGVYAPVREISSAGVMRLMLDSGMCRRVQNVVPAHHRYDTTGVCGRHKGLPFEVPKRLRGAWAVC